MAIRKKSGSRISSAKPRKTSRSKVKSKTQKNTKIKYAPQEKVPSVEEISQKTCGVLENLGNQKFALSPFSQYFDDWLINLRQAFSEFESNPSVKVDSVFVNSRSEIFAEVEGTLAEIRIKEADLEASAKELSETNHRIVELDAEYASENRELANKRNSDIENASKKVHDLEEELVRVGQLKTSFFGFTKRAKKRKEEEVSLRLNATKAELEVVVQNFAAEQEKLHDEYERKKQEAIEKVRRLEHKIADIEKDRSVDARREATLRLQKMIAELEQRKASSS